MSQIYVDTDHSNHNKLYNADKAGNHAADAVKTIHKAVKQVVKDDAGFTSLKAKKGYRIRLKLTKYQTANKETTCAMSGEIVRYPPTKNKKGETGEIMVSAGMSAGEKVPGTSKGAFLDCAHALATKLVEDSLPEIKKDADKR